MKYITLVLVLCSSVISTPISNNGDKRQKKSPQLDLLPFSPISPVSDPFLSELGLSESELQFKNAQKPLANKQQTRSYYESGNNGAVGVFPSAKTAVGAIPLLLSCSPNVVSGQLSSTIPTKPLYRTRDESGLLTDSARSFNSKQFENSKFKRLADEKKCKKIEKYEEEKQAENSKETPREVHEKSKETKNVLKLQLKVKKEVDN